jgi:hypothetical protein
MEPSLAVDASLSVDITDELIQVNLHGELTVERLTRAMTAVARDSRFRHGMNAIADFRSCVGQWDYSEMQRFRDYLVRIPGSRPCRWAVVVPRGALEAVAHVVIVISEAASTNISLRMFEEMPSAQRWVNGAPE